MTYTRTANQKFFDYERAKVWENELGAVLQPHVVSRLSSPDELDHWVPGVFIDQKEKNGPISNRWPLPPGVDERDCFILDELSVRRAARHWPASYFLIRDNPGGGRIFLAPLYEVIAVERTRVQRGGKGKWIIDLSNFRTVESLEHVLPTILEDQIAMPWKSSACLSQKEIPQV